MNIDAARTEALARFGDFSNAFQQSYRVIIAALTHIRELVSSPDGVDVLQALLVNARPTWHALVPAPDVTAQEAFQTALRLSIVQIYSAADAFVTDLEADYDRWAGLRSLPSNSMLDESVDSSDRLEKVCLRFGWKLGEVSELSPLLRFFRQLRDCIAHRTSVASFALVETAADKQTIGAIQRLAQSKLFGILPRLPLVKAEEKIGLEPEHQFFCLATVGHVIRYVDSQFRQWLGRDGLVYLAAYHTLLADSPSVATEAYRGATNVINHALVTRYDVLALDESEIVPILTNQGVWQACVKAHAHHYGI